MSTPAGKALPDRRPGRDLVAIADLDADEICAILADARALIPVATADGPRGRALLAGRSIVNFFGEPSTRTRTSFEIAAARLHAHTVDFYSGERSSATKGETLRDTVRNIDAMGVDVIVVRHRTDGLPRQLAGWCRARIVNAGDGRHEHPTQALLDCLTILEARNKTLQGAQTFAGLTVAICGDVENGRVAHSDILALQALGATVRVAGPPQLLSDETGARYDVPVLRDLPAALDGADVIIMLRIQRERLATTLDMSDEEYHAAWGLTPQRLADADEEVVVMHPGPINRGIELADEVADGENSRILRQVALGVPVRMAVLARACAVTVQKEETR